MKSFLIFACLFLGSLSPSACAQEDILFGPQFCSAEELARELDHKTLDMCWHLGKESHFRFVSGKNSVYFEIYLGEDAHDLALKVKDQCIENAGQFVFSYKIDPDGSEEINRPQERQKQGNSSEDVSYLVAERRVFKQTKPQRMSQEELAHTIQNQKVLFYTGAGISLASDVPAMRELIDSLGLETGEKMLLSLETAFKNPREFAANIQAFHQACLFSSPTPAHLALKELTTLKQVRIITENLDCLHEASGIYPYRINAQQVREEMGNGYLSQFDAVICVGLSHDDRGFLAWYKQQNPQGKIIAVDLQQPSYLGDEDFLVVGDLQELFSSIERPSRPL